MKAIYRGKTKDVHALDNGHYLLTFKDSVTGSDGVFDPGANEVAFEIEGMGRLNLRCSVLFFEALAARGVPTHYIDSDIEAGTMEVEPARPFGYGVEVICRYRAVGSFLRRYGRYVEEGARLDGYVEVTLKDDERGDPLITCEGLEALQIMTAAQYEDVCARTREISGIVREILADHGLELYDIKLEFGRDARDQVLLIDEIAGGNMRAYRDGEVLDPETLSAILLGD